jgi:hypothetical protein
MRGARTVVLLLAGTVLLAAGCVERRMLIRSEPPGAPVWVDEQHLGSTPVDHPFVHYGWRRVRIGPIRDADDKVQYLEKQLEVEVPAPWYETFPLDFFFEVLYPGRMTDEHLLPVFVLDAAERAPAPASTAEVEELRRQAADFRRRALYAVPEAAPVP